MEDSLVLEDGEGEEEPLPTKAQLEMLILKYLQVTYSVKHQVISCFQPVHRQLADLHSRLEAVEEKLAGREGE